MDCTQHGTDGAGDLVIPLGAPTVHLATDKHTPLLKEGAQR